MYPVLYGNILENINVMLHFSDIFLGVEHNGIPNKTFRVCGLFCILAFHCLNFEFKFNFLSLPPF